MKKAVFFDRDGVINDNSKLYYTFKSNDFIFNPGAKDVVKKFFDLGYLVFIITNQGGVSKGEYTSQDVIVLNEFILNQFSDINVDIKEIFFCPHHSNIEKCLCRKPNSLMLEKAVAKYNINVSNSLMIGDSHRDIEAAQKIGINGILIEPNSDMRNKEEILTLL